jgi:hypothetical protein
MRRCSSRTLCKGIALPAVLVVIVITSLMAAATLQEVATDRSLATARQLHQRAFEMAELGAAQTIADLQPVLPTLPATRTLQPDALLPDSAEIFWREVARTALPAGYSAGRFVETHTELRSTGRSARNASVTQVVGLRSIVPVEASRP